MSGQVHHIAQVAGIDIVMVEFSEVNGRPEGTRRFLLEAVNGDGEGSVRFLNAHGNWQELSPDDPRAIGHGVVVWNTVVDAAIATRLASYLGKMDSAGPVGKVVLDWISKRGWAAPSKFKFASP